MVSSYVWPRCSYSFAQHSALQRWCVVLLAMRLRDSGFPQHAGAFQGLGIIGVRKFSCIDIGLLFPVGSKRADVSAAP